METTTASTKWVVSGIRQPAAITTLQGKGGDLLPRLSRLLPFSTDVPLCLSEYEDASDMLNMQAIVRKTPYICLLLTLRGLPGFSASG